MTKVYSEYSIPSSLAIANVSGLQFPPLFGALYPLYWIDHCFHFSYPQALVWGSVHLGDGAPFAHSYGEGTI